MLIPTSKGSFTHSEDPGEAPSGNPRISVTDVEAKILTGFARGKEVLEIGTGLGISTRALIAEAIKVVTLDPDPWVATTIFAGLRDLGVICTQDRDRVRRECPYDLIFIDGEHSRESVKEDLTLAFECLAPGGMIVLHDMFGQGVRDAASEFPMTLLVIETTYGLGLVWRDPEASYD